MKNPTFYALMFVFGVTCTAILMLALAGCRDVEEIEVQSPGEKNTSTRFTAESQGAFKAGYGDHTREILLITDTRTGKKYLAVTGCGVTELWQETEGKHTRTVEE